VEELLLLLLLADMMKVCVVKFVCMWVVLVEWFGCSVGFCRVA